MENIVEQVMKNGPAGARLRLAVGYLGSHFDSPEVQKLQNEVKKCPEVRTMLAPMQGGVGFPRNTYQKWKGAFWTLLVLADLGYPAGDKALLPLAEQDYEWLLGENHLRSIKVIDGRWRRCVCQEGGALFSLVRLGLMDVRLERLAASIKKWQWPDGGWNCDKHPSASHSSFHESLIPLRALNVWWQVSHDPAIKEAMDRAVELFLSHSLYRRTSNGQIIHPDFITLAYPAFWHYNILEGLKVLGEMGRLSDPRCKDALDLLESKRLPDGGFTADTKYFQVSPESKTGTTFVDWGGVSHTRMNPYITAEALSILKQAGRI